MSRAEQVKDFKRLPRPDGWPLRDRGLRGEAQASLVELRGFGSNPGALRMLSFVPAKLQQPRALVVVLHGCGQSAASYDLGAGWSTLAKHYGFALLLPQQQPANNANGCFNWFNTEDIARGRGEAGSIRQMIARMVRDYGIDKRHVFICGLSAGGAMTSVMLAAYPEVFAAGAIIAGLPFGIAGNIREALKAMRAPAPLPAQALGDLVRNASSHRGPWPRVSVWHGSADRAVNPANASEVVKQWLDVHHLPPAPMSAGMVDGHPRQVWWNAEGQTVVESYTITAMAHGTPLGPADDGRRYGKQGAFLIEVGISSSYHIAKFFGLAGWIRDANPSTVERPSTKLPWPLARAHRPSDPALKPKPTPQKGRRVTDIVSRVLTAVGLKR